MTNPALDAGEAAPSPPMDLRRDGGPVAFLAVLFLLSIGLAMAFSSTFFEQNLRAFNDPESLGNPVIYLAIVVVFTLIILAIARWGKRIIIKYIVLGSVLLTIYYVAAPLLGTAMDRGGVLLGFSLPDILGGIIAVALTALLWFFPEWYVIDTVGVLVAAGAAGIFGISFGLLPSLLLLVAFAVYDAIAVYRTKHMLDLADSVLELRLPIMFVVPKHRGYSFLEETRKVRTPAPDDKPERREAMFMGLGDAVIPGVLVVSALTFLNPGAYEPGQAPAWSLVAPDVLGLDPWIFVGLTTVLGSLVGFFALMWFVLKGNPQAGLPLLNGGAILGFFLGLLPLYGLAPINPFA